MESHNRVFILACLDKYKVNIHKNARVAEIEDKGVHYLNESQERCFVQGDMVVLAVGYQSDQTLFQEIRPRIKEVYCIGDCVKPRTGIEAIHEGYEVGLKI